MMPLKRLARSCWPRSWAWSRWRIRTGRNSVRAEVGAGLAGRFHPAVEFGRAGADAVSEHPGLGFSAQAGQAGAFVVGRQFGRLPVERVDLGANGGVLVGDDLVGDPGVDQGHLHLLFAQQGDGLEPHAAVGRLGGQRAREPQSAGGVLLAGMPLRSRAVLGSLARSGRLQFARP
jgi:hypothetical protein